MSNAHSGANTNALNKEDLQMSWPRIYRLKIHTADKTWVEYYFNKKLANAVAAEIKASTDWHFRFLETIVTPDDVGYIFHQLDLGHIRAINDFNNNINELKIKATTDWPVKKNKKHTTT